GDRSSGSSPRTIWRKRMTSDRKAPAVSVRGLRKSFGQVEAVKGVDFEVAPGEVFGFLGPNGAGKTTTISMLCTLVTPTGGTARAAGHAIAPHRTPVRLTLALASHAPTLAAYLTAD